MLSAGRLDAIVYDLEIVAMIPDRRTVARMEGVRYCDGWTDYAGMGVACACAVDLYTGRPHIFLEDNLPGLQQLAASRRHLVGFNSIMFDDKVMAGAGFPVTTTYDLKVEAGGVIKGRKVPGRRLADFARANLGVEKDVGNHADLPAYWQHGEHGLVINECMSDVFLLARLVQLIETGLIDPVTGREIKGLRSLNDTTQFDALLVGPARLDGDRHGN